MRLAEPPATERVIRVVVVDDHAPVLAGLRRVLTRALGIELVAALADHRPRPAVIERGDVDVVILDYDRERGDALTQCLHLKQRRGAPAVVVYSGYAGAGIQLAAAAAGAD